VVPDWAAFWTRSSCRLASSASALVPLRFSDAIWSPSCLICRLMLLIAFAVRVLARATAKALAIRAAISGSESVVVIVRKLLSLVVGSVGPTETWPSRLRAAEGGIPRTRAARRPTTGVFSRVCASAVLDFAVMRPSKIEPATVGCTLIVACDW
jgi:hypothetical protein